MSTKWTATQAWEASYQHTRRNLKTRQQRIKRFNLPLTAHILDFGCGDGLDLTALQQLGYQTVIGLDNSFDLLRNHSAATRLQGDAYKMAFPDDTFDVVFVDSVFHHLQFEAALRSIYRVLKPTGQLCFIEPRPSWGRKLLDLATFSPLAQVWPLLGHRRITLLDELEEHYAWLEQAPFLETYLHQAGFQHIKYSTDWINMFVSCQKPGFKA